MTDETNDVKEPLGDGENNGQTDGVTECKEEPEGNGDADADTENDQEHLQLTVGDADKIDTSNADNEDSLNLTIGEDEAKIFQDDEVCKLSQNKNPFFL